MKLSQRRFRSDVRKLFFFNRVAGHQNRISREVVITPNLTELKKAFRQCS